MYFEVFDLSNFFSMKFIFLKPMMLWEQEIYVPFSYNKINKDWYYFAGDVSFFMQNKIISRLIKLTYNHKYSFIFFSKRTVMLLLVFHFLMKLLFSMRSSWINMNHQFLRNIKKDSQN